MIGVQYYPQGGLATLSQGLERLRNLAYVICKVAELFTCPNYLEPDECKNGTDKVFEIAFSISQELWMRFVGYFEASTSSGTVQKNPDEAKKRAIDFTQSTVEIKGDDQKAEQITKALKFVKYDQSNLCDIKEGIPPSEYDVTVDEIADLTNMPVKLKNTIKRAKNFAGGNVLAVNRLQFEASEANLVFGRLAVIRRGKLLDLAYSLHSVEYELMPNQRQPKRADKLHLFFGSLKEGDSVDGKTAFDRISIELRGDFLAFFHNQAIKGFIKHCDFITHSDNVAITHNS